MSSSIRPWVLCALWLGTVVAGMQAGARLAAAEKVLTIPAPETTTLTTRDGVVLRCTFYPGGLLQKSAKEVVRVPGKQVVPVVILHGWEGQRREFHPIAGLLQRLGHAVVVPDLRGHGESTKGAVPRERMGGGDINRMLLDVEAVRRFLLERNNSGELNLNMLCLIGSKLGALVAVNWAALDWSRPQLPSYRPGRDVKALILVSPVASFKGATLNHSLQHPVFRGGVSVMIIAGKGERTGRSDATAIYNRLERFQGTVQPKSASKGTVGKLLFLTPDTSLVGTDLLTAKGLTVQQDVVRFLQQRLVSRAESFPWSERKSPLSLDQPRP